MNQSVLLGEQNIHWASYDFRGGRITTILGGQEIDLTECYISTESQIINLNIVCGNVTLIVTRDWNVQLDVLPILGIVEDEIRYSPTCYIDAAAKLKIKGSIIMGCLRIKRT